MTEPRSADHQDDWMLDLIAAVYDETDPVPTTLVPESFSFSDWASPDAGVELVLGDLETVAVRDEDAVLSRPVVHVDLGLTVTIDLESMSGDIRPWQGGTAWIEYTDGRPDVEVEVDEDGEFTLRVAGGVARLVVRVTEGVTTTPGFLISRGRSS